MGSKKPKKDENVSEDSDSEDEGGQDFTVESGRESIPNCLLPESKLPRLQQFVPGSAPEINLFYTVTFYGKRRTGKSVAVKWFLQFFKHEIPWYWCFTLTQLNSFYAGFIPEKFIIPDFNGHSMDAIMERQKAARRKFEKNPNFNPRACVIWDDYNGNDITYNKQLANYYYTGRHYFTLNVFCAQHITLTPPAIRSNTDLAILFNTDYADSIEHYNRDWAGKLDKDQFQTMFAMATCKEHHFLAIDNNPITPLEKKFFTGVALELDEGPDWILGCQEAWRDNQKQLYAIQTGSYSAMAKAARELAVHHPPPSMSNKSQEPPVTHPDNLNSVEGKDCMVTQSDQDQASNETVEARSQRIALAGVQRQAGRAMGIVGGRRDANGTLHNLNPNRHRRK